MLWVADFRPSSGTYCECTDLFGPGLDLLSATDKEWIMGKAVTKFLIWPEPQTMRRQGTHPLFAKKSWQDKIMTACVKTSVQNKS